MSNKKPIFQSIFLNSWNKLPKVMHKHYANRPLSNDIVVVEGKMDIEFGWFIKILSPFFKASNTLVPYEGSDIPVTVRFLSEPDSHAFCLERIFYLPNKKPYIFYSKLTQLHDDIVIEIMKSNIGWKHRFYYNGKKIILEPIFRAKFRVKIGLYKKLLYFIEIRNFYIIFLLKSFKP